jgi:spore germination cell wall hydrolase CwlJ-like protein
LTTKTQARAPARALVGAAAFGSLAGLAIGCAYLGGEAARESMVRAQAERFAGAAKSGYSEQSLVAAAGGLDRNALAIARRHDSYTIAGGAERDRQAAQFAAQVAPQGARLASQSAGLRQATFHPVAAQPFHEQGALDASRDLECLTEAVYWEARGEGSAGMAAVAQVVLNRVRHPAFPKTVCGVVYQGASDGGCQFSFACSGHHGHIEDSMWVRSREVAARALSGHVFAAVGGATHFHAASVSPDWMGSLQKVAQIGSHIFYRFSRHPKDFRYAAAPTEPKAPQPMLAGLVPTFGGAPTPASAPLAAAKPASAPVLAFPVLQKAAPTAEAATAPADTKPAAALAAKPAVPPAPKAAAAGARVIDAPTGEPAKS